LYCPLVSLQGLLHEPQPHQRVAEIGERGRKVRLQGDGFFLAFARLLEALQPEQRKAQIGMGFRRTRIDRDRARKRLLGLSAVSAFEFDDTEQMQRIEMIGKDLDNPPAQGARIGVPAAPVLKDRALDQGRGFLPELLLQPRILEGARTDMAGQLPTPSGKRSLEV